MRANVPPAPPIDLEAGLAEKLATIAAIFDLRASEGRIPQGLDPRIVINTLIRPLVLASLNGDTHLSELPDFVVDRFLASYRPAPAAGAR